MPTFVISMSMEHKNIILLICLTSIIFLTAHAQCLAQNVSDSLRPNILVRDSIKYDSINLSKYVTIDSIKYVSPNLEFNLSDSLFFKRIETLNTELFRSRIEFIADSSYITTYNYSKNTIPKFDESVYRHRFEELDASTPIKLEYNNIVRKYIDRYTLNGKTYTEKLLGLTTYYFPIIEEILIKYNLPLELKYLSIIESGLNPNVTSSMGAKGLWQFMPSTGKLYGLDSTSYIDGRLDIIKSTEAACLHLKDLYDIYGDWILALAAYNSGVGNVNKAINRSGGKRNYWQIYTYLPDETRNYVPAFSALSYVCTYHSEHNLRPQIPQFTFFDVDTVIVNKVISFNQISEEIGTSVQDLELLNPEYIKDVVPGSKEHPCRIVLPANDAVAFAVKHQKKETKKKKENSSTTNVQSDSSSTDSDGEQFYIVKKGDNLSTIAKKNHTTVKKIMEASNLKSDKLKIGQKLKLR